MRKSLLIAAVLGIIASIVYAMFFTGSQYSDYDYLCVYKGKRGHAVGVKKDDEVNVIDVNCEYNVLGPIEA